MALVNKELIISLIQQDLKHNQLTTGLTLIGHDSEIYSLEIVDIVAQLMGIDKDEISDQWADIYFSFFDQAHHYEVSEKALELKVLATRCFEKLAAIMEYEKFSIQ